jgi:hypothetical protein
MLSTGVLRAAPSHFSQISQEYINIVGESLVLRNVVRGSVSTVDPHVSPIGVPTLSIPALGLMLLAGWRSRRARRAPARDSHAELRDAVAQGDLSSRRHLAVAHLPVN